MLIVLFDSEIKTKKGWKPFWEQSYVDSAHDQELTWFHESYGRMKLYRLHRVDDRTFIAEDLNKTCRTSNPNWDIYLEHPEFAVNSPIQGWNRGA